MPFQMSTPKKHFPASSGKGEATTETDGKKKKRRQNPMETRHVVGGVLHDFGSSGGAGVRGARPGPRRPSQPSLPARVSAVAIAFRCNYDQTTLSPEACLR